MLDPMNLVSKLKEEALKNVVSKDVFILFTTRKRSRSCISLHNLWVQMSKAGFMYKKEDYVPTLRFLVSVGVGSLVLSSKGRVKGVKDIKLTLQSIGYAASNEGGLRNLKTKTKFTAIVPKVTTPTITAPVAPKNPKSMFVGVVFMINGKCFKIDVPENFTKEDITDLIAKYCS